MISKSTYGLKIAILSLADINNYGDVFFPYVFRAELMARLPEAKIDLYTNTEYSCELYNTSKFSLQQLSKYDAVILAGGETIQRLDEEEWNDIYDKTTDGRFSDIVFSWLTLDKPFKAYFAVGVHPCMDEHREDLLLALKRLDYLAVRGELSKKIFENSIVGNYNQIRIVPDLGWMFNNYIDMLERDGLCVTKIPREPYMVFEMFYEFDDDTLQFAARELVRFQEETKVNVVLLPIVHTKSKKALSTWNDYYTLSRLVEYSGGALTLMPDKLSITDVGRLLRGAKFYLGSSMHGAVTCLAYGNPAGNVLTWTAPKLQDFHGARMRTDCFINHWGKLPSLLRCLNKEAEDETNVKYAKMYSDYMRYRLSVEIDELCEQILGYVNERMTL